MMHRTRSFCALALVLSMLAGCSAAKTESIEKESLAKKFSEQWIARWDTVEGNDILLAQGKIFLCDLNGDQTPELFFITPEMKDSAVTVFDLKQEPIAELGKFRTSAASDEEELVFSIYKGEGNTVLHSEAQHLTGFADPTLPITDYYVSYDGKELGVTMLYRCESKEGGEPIYFDSPYDGVEITKAEYEKLRTDAQQGGTLTDSVTVSGKDVAFLEEGALERYVLSLLTQWEEAVKKEGV